MRRTVGISVPVCLTLACLACGGDDNKANADRPSTSIAAPLFSERAADSGLDFVHFNGMSGELYIAEMMGGGAALFDYDNDGDLDLYVTQGCMLDPSTTTDQALFPLPGDAPLQDRLFRNDLVVRADGTREISFVDVTFASGLVDSGYGMGVTAADYDNDGFTDLYVTNFGENQLLHNDGDGRFSDVTRASGTGDTRWSVPAVFFDYDRDGRLDLFVGNYVSFRVAAHKVCPSTAGRPDYCGPLAYEPEPDRLFRNRGDGTFEDVTTRAGLGRQHGNALGAIPADFDGDGWLDLFVANDGMANFLWMNRRDGTFEERGLLAGCAFNADGQPEASMGVDAADFDGDGDEDLFMTHLSRETNTLYVNDGRGGFDDGTVQSGVGPPSLRHTGFGTGWFDYDNDGLLDLLAVNGAVYQIEELVARNDPFPLHQPNQLLRNVGNGRFEETTAAAGPAFAASEVSRGAAFGDVDNDGDLDVVVVNNGGPLRLLVNETGQRRGWVGLRLVGAAGRDMLGAWVGLHRPGSVTLWRRVRTAGSYASANDPRVLFGLGDDERVGHVEVRWPDGRTERFDQIAPRAYTTLRQGAGRPIPP